MDAGNVLRIDVVPDLRGGFLVNRTPHLLIAFPGIRRLLGNPRRVFFQNIPQRPGNLVDIRLGLLQFVRIQIYILHRLRGCQQFHVAVKNVPPLGHHGGGAGLVPQSKVRVIVVVPDHQAVQPRPHRHKCRQTQQQCRQHHPPVLARIQPQAVILCFHGPPPS